MTELLTRTDIASVLFACFIAVCGVWCVCKAIKDSQDAEEGWQ